MTIVTILCAAQDYAWVSPMPPADLTDLLTSAEVAQRKNVDISTVNRWAKSGKLPTAFQINGGKRAIIRYFRPEDADAAFGQANAA